MRKTSFALALVLAASASTVLAAPKIDPAAAPAGHYELDPRHASVTARVLHMGLSHYTMRIGQVSGSYDYDPTHPLASRIAINLDARSLDTGTPAVSKEFAGEFLDADAHPQISFVSTAIDQSDANHGTVTGDLTFHGVTRPVTLTVTYNGYSSGLIGGQRMGFSATGVVRRSDFGSKAWLNDVGDDVQLTIEAEFARK